MRRIACIVEGQGDVISIPIILRRIAAHEEVFDLEIVGTYRIPRYSLVRPGELERAVERAARTLGGAGGILVVIDADDDVACVLGPALAARAKAARQDVPSRVVIANREKEAWFLAAVESLRDKRGIESNANSPENPEAIRGAKGRMAELMGGPYSEVADEPAFSAVFDLEMARARAHSFDKFWRSATELISPAEPAES